MAKPIKSIEINSVHYLIANPFDEIVDKLFSPASVFFCIIRSKEVLLLGLASPVSSLKRVCWLLFAGAPSVHP